MFLSSSTRAIFDIVAAFALLVPAFAVVFVDPTLPARPQRIKPKARAGRARVTLLHRSPCFRLNGRHGARMLALTLKCLR